MKHGRQSQLRYPDSCDSPRLLPDPHHVCCSADMQSAWQTWFRPPTLSVTALSRMSSMQVLGCTISSSEVLSNTRHVRGAWHETILGHAS